MSDPDGVAEILTATAPDLLHYFEWRERADAADLLGETLLVAWRRVGDMPRDPVEARMWLFGIARMVLLGHGRDKARQVRLADKLRAVASRPALDTDATLDVRNAIAALPADQAELIRLVHWEGFTIADAATVMGLNPSTARGRYQRAREALALDLAQSIGQNQR